jgi:hypothetical protein
VDDDQSSIAGFLRESVAATPPPARCVTRWGRAPVMAEVGDALFRAVRELADPAPRRSRSTTALTRDMTDVAERYRDDAWTWRR